MRIGVVGLGKLGLPVATCISLRGHQVVGYDVAKERMTKEPQKYKETGIDGIGDFNTYLSIADNLNFGSLQNIGYCDIIFVAVQTPHDERFEGTQPLPNEREDFDYTFLRRAIGSLVPHILKPTPIVVISTVLPGTIKREIKPFLTKNMKLVYNPFFIAMGTVMYDFLHPEFVLLGVEDKEACEKVIEFYKTVFGHPVPFCKMSIESAELTKVAYNTYISQKICFVNTLMEICHNIEEANVDDVTNALKMATDRLISPKYLTAGMGDGGGCHPRDNIAMSWLAKKMKLSHNLFDDIMKCREDQARFLVDLMFYYHQKTSLPLKIFGYAFKPETNITTGSPALLVKNLMYGAEVELWDHHVLDEPFPNHEPAVYLIGCKHPEYVDLSFPKGSVIIDPFRYIPDQKDVEVIRIGE